METTISKMEATTSRIEEILKRGYEDLDRFYKNHGESKKGVDRKEKSFAAFNELSYTDYGSEFKKVLSLNNEIDELPKKIKAIPKKIEKENIPPVEVLEDIPKEDLPIDIPKEDIPDIIIYETVPSKKEKTQNLDIVQMLNKMTGKQIIDLIEDKTVHAVTISVKSKKCLVKKAITLLKVEDIEEEHTTVLKQEQKQSNRIIHMESMKAIDIVKMIEKKTGVKITICLKSKKNIIRHAEKILKEKNIENIAA